MPDYYSPDLSDGNLIVAEPPADKPAPAVSHPAKFSDSILSAIYATLQKYLPQGARILDPFAGEGRIHELRDDPHYETWGVELEPEWAEQSPYTVVGDSRNLADLRDLGPWDAIVTSPAYGNRMADSYAGDGTRRYTYRIALGRPLTEDSGAGMHYGPKYRTLHSIVWAECARTVRPGGLVILNVSNFIKRGAEVQVSEWHLMSWLNMGFKLLEVQRIGTPRMRDGANGQLRVDGELLIVLQAPGGDELDEDADD